MQVVLAASQGCFVVAQETLLVGLGLPFSSCNDMCVWLCTRHQFQGGVGFDIVQACVAGRSCMLQTVF